MFRGYFINVFKKNGFWKSIIFTALLFGIFHLDPFRLLPATLNGIWLGYLLLKTNSIFVPIFAHFVNNSLAVLIGKFGDQIPVFNNFFKGDELPFWMGIPAIILFYFLLKIFNSLNKNYYKTFFGGE